MRWLLFWVLSFWGTPASRWYSDWLCLVCKHRIGLYRSICPACGYPHTRRGAYRYVVLGRGQVSVEGKFTDANSVRDSEAHRRAQGLVKENG